MARFLVILLLSISLEVSGQSGKYQIDTINGKGAEGSITLNPYTVTVEQDSFKLVLPVLEILEQNRRTIYILEGCVNNVSFKGSATLMDYETNLIEGKIGLALYIEIRTKQGYSFTRYGLFYNE